MRRLSIIRTISLSSLLMYALLAAGPMLHCHGLEEAPGHEDHCQGCQWTHFSTDTADKSPHSISVYIVIGDVLPQAPFYSAFTPDSILHNRAPPV